MKKIKITLGILIVLAMLAISFLSIQNIPTISAEQIKKSSFTKAICDENKFCQDYQIYCENNLIKQKTPITGASIQFQEDWKDPRTEEEQKIYCK
jgi:hypothetical protein